MLLSRKVTLLVLGAAVVCLALIITTNYTDACLLEEVTLNREPVPEWGERFGLHPDRSIVRQPVDSLTELLLDAKNVFRVDVSYRLPDRIDITLNDFEPVCFLLDASSGVMYGLTDDARVVTLDNGRVNWEHPVLTSVQTGALYRYCPDARVGVLVEQLEQLRGENIDLYRLIDEIDLAHKSFVQVSLSGLPYRLKAGAEDFCEEMIQFVEFVSRFVPDLSEVNSIDMRFGGMIICAGGKR